MKVLVVDDSALMRRYLGEMLSSVTGISVITARDGQDALQMIEREKPDVVTLDINMPVMDGLTCLSHIMTRFPLPVVMVSSLTDASALATFEALEMGAVDYIAKPGGTVSMNIKEVRNELVMKVRAAHRSRQKVRGRRVVAPPVPQPEVASGGGVAARGDIPGVVAIGVSTGGPSTLEAILPALPASFPLPVLVCQHMPGNFTKVFAERLNTRCKLEVQELCRSTRLEVGNIYVARGDTDMQLSIRSGVPYLLTVPAGQQYNWHPSVSRMLESIIQHVPTSRTVGVMLTGMGNDGAKEMTQIYQGGGVTLAECEKDCAVFGMPKALIDLGGASRVVEVANMPNAIVGAAQTIAKKGAIKQWA